jgi:acyl-CoA reductase-like NAD-dependent aldehyde dehydrogenase
MTSSSVAHLTDFVDGKPVAADPSSRGIDLVAPQTGRSIGTIAESSSSGVDRAVAAASAAFAANCKQTGALWINEATCFRFDNYPFGGMKRSGVGREVVSYAIEELSQIKIHRHHGLISAGSVTGLLMVSKFPKFRMIYAP